MTSVVDVPEQSPFTLAGLPYGCVRLSRTAESFVGVAIGDSVFNLGAAVEQALLHGCQTTSCPQRHTRTSI